jgi:hypothetical protein
MHSRPMYLKIRTIYDLRTEHHITHYEFFDLRDANSADPGYQFGLLRDDYTPKPAFERYRQLIAELVLGKSQDSSPH